MGTYLIIFLLGQSILFPLVTGLVRYRRISRTYRPFFLLIVIGCFTEIISYIVVKIFRNNMPVVNIYYLIEWLIIAWQFHVWGFLRQKRRIFFGLLLFSVLFWATENLLFQGIMHVKPYFLFFYFFLTVMLSINEINFMITHQSRSLFRDPRFLICIGLIIYFLYMIIYYWAFEISKYGQPEMMVRINYFMAYVNVVTNVIYALAFLFIPAPQKFTLEAHP